MCGLVRFEIVNRLDHIDARHAVDARVMHFRDDRVAAFRQAVDVVETFDHGEFPQWFREIQRPRMQPRRLNAQLSPVTRLRQPNVANVKFEIEILVFDPVRVVEAERHVDELLAERPRAVQTLFDVAQDRLESLHAAGQRRLVVDLNAADVHRRARRFEIQKRRVHCGELLHVSSLCLYMPRMRGSRLQRNAQPSAAGPPRRGARMKTAVGLLRPPLDSAGSKSALLLWPDSSRPNSSRTSLPPS